MICCKKTIFKVLVCLLIIPATTEAQRVRSKDEPETREKVEHSDRSRIWYGGGIQIGFSGYNGENVFLFGLSPMAGYKIVEKLSVGPRVEMNYTSLKRPGFKAASLFDIDAGVFLRWRVFRGFFLQGELSNEWYQQVYINSNEKANQQRFNQRVGLGYNFGNGMGGGASEVGIFYNFVIANDLETYETPWGYRFGFTWNF